MHADLRRTIIALGFTLLVAVCVVSVHRVNAYDINDVVDENTTKEVYETVCQAQNILDGIQRIQDGYIQQLVRDTINELKDSLVTYAFAVLQCYAYADLTSVVSVVFAGEEFTFEGPSCDQDLGGAATAALKRATLDKIKNDFTARCIADGVGKKAQDDARQLILENGPDGGPAYVTSWIEDIYVGEDQRAIRRFCAVLANTEVCPYMRTYIFNYFGEKYGCPRSYFENPPNLGGLGGRVDGGDSFVQRAQCTLPAGVSPAAIDYDNKGYGGFDMLNLLMHTQNHPDSFISMAETELAAQREKAVRAAESEAVAGGGFRSLYGDATSSCLHPDPNGFCFTPGLIRQPSGAVRDGNAAALQYGFDRIGNAVEMNSMMGDVRRRLASMLMTIDEMPLGYDIEFDGSSQDYMDIGSGIRPPDDVNLPEDPDGVTGPGPRPDSDSDGQPDSVECPAQPCADTDGDGQPDSTDTDSDNDGLPDSTDLDLNNDGIPDRPPPIGAPPSPLCAQVTTPCFCVVDQSGYFTIRDVAADAVEAATVANNDLVTPPSCAGNACSVPPQNQGLFLIAVCDTSIGRAFACRPKAGSTDTIVFGSDNSVSITVIQSGTGRVLVPGQTIAACPAGVQ